MYFCKARKMITIGMMVRMVAAMTGRREFLDVGFGLGLIGFVGTCAFAVFIMRKGKKEQ